MPDVILVNGNIHTMDLYGNIVQAVAIEAGKIQNTGSNEEILMLKGESTKIIDLAGRTVLPGFNDSHMHLYDFGNSLNMVQLSQCRSIKDIISVAKKFIEENNIEKGKWIIGRGWNQDYFTDCDRFPNRYDLDKISEDHPIVLIRACCHIAVVNSKALDIAQITEQTQKVEGGEVDVNDEGNILGIFRENALELIYSVLPVPDKEDIIKNILKAVKYANSKGITSIQTDDFGNMPAADYRLAIMAYEELKKRGQLTVRINEQCLLPEIGKLKNFIADGYAAGYGDELFKLGPLKLLSDGSLGARTAALTKPYEDDIHNKGILAFSQEELDALIKTAHDADMQIAVHCIGDKAMHMTFESIKKALAANPRENHRHAIVHCQITDKELLNAFEKFNIIALVQPIFLHYDLHIVEDRIGKLRMQDTYAFKTMIDAGVHVAFGTDCPIELLDVMPNIYCAVTRKDKNGYPDNGWLPAQKVTVEEAIRCYTIEGAYASFEEEMKGSIEIGKLADMVVLDRDIFKIDENDIINIEVLMTFLGGNIVYDKSNIDH